MNIKKPNFWDQKSLSVWAALLLPVSLIYKIIFLTYKNLSSLRKFPIPIICVGNIYIGGTGKTPLAREVFKIIKSLKKEVAFVKKSHNYLRDEIEMLKKTGTTFLCKKRSEGLFRLIDNKYEVAVLDDGFQDFSIKPDLSILCFNSKQLIGNGFLIPSGPLRENLKAISRCQCIVINGEKELEFENKIKDILGNKNNLEIFYSNYKLVDIEKFQKKEIIAFAGIGNPSNFFDLLKKNNLKITKTFSYPDHYNYTQKDFDKMLEDKSKIILTTEKDYYRLNDNQKKSCDFIKVNLEIENINKLKNLINQYI